MKHVVMIAYFFPPEGSVGTYRTLRFIRQLPNFGWSPKVVTVRSIQYERFDPGLVSSIPAGTEVVRVNGHDLWQAFQAWRSRRLRAVPSTEANDGPQGQEPQRVDNGSSGFRERLRDTARAIEASWYHPDMSMPWIANAVEATVEFCKRFPIQILWATAGPVSSLYVVHRSSVRTNIPYVLDFRDPWTITRTDFDRIRPAWATRRDRKGMFRLLQGAQAVVFRHATEAECFWRAYPGALEAQKIHLIPNGFEGQVEEFTPANEKKCTILYAGTLSSYRFSTFLEGVTLLKQTESHLAKSLCLRFVGEGAQLVGREAAARGISDIVVVRDPVRSSELPSLYSRSHALLVLGREPGIIGYELLVGAKVFEYLKAGRPIIGVLPHDQTRHELENVGVKTIADADSPRQIAHLLRHILEQWSLGNLASLVPDKKACETYSSDRQTAALVRALEGLPAEEAFIPGCHDIPSSLRDIIGPNGWLNN
jgi:hypothetical protein